MFFLIFTLQFYFLMGQKNIRPVNSFMQNKTEFLRSGLEGSGSPSDGLGIQEPLAFTRNRPW